MSDAGKPEVDRAEQARALLAAMLKAQKVHPYRGWNITELNRAADAARELLGLPSIRLLNPDIARMQDAATANRDKLAALSPVPTREAVDHEDAERWRALMRCPRIKMQGSAGVDPKTGVRTYPDLPGSVHFGAEFWPTPARDPATGEIKIYSDCDEAKTQWGRHALRALADDILAVEAALTESGDGE